MDCCTENSPGYRLCLANGQKWLFTTTEELTRWLEKLAEAMQLSICEPDGYAHIVFMREQSGEHHGSESIMCLMENAGTALSTSGWEYQDIGAIRFWWKSGAGDVICQIQGGNGSLEFTVMRDSLYPIYQQAQESGGLALHAGLIAMGEKGVLLAGTAGMGKSTCCRRIPKPWQVLCDEECLVVQGGQDNYLVHPFPTWSDCQKQFHGRTWNVQRCVPLSAVFFLEQAEMDEVVQMGQGEAAAYINDSATQVLRRIHHYLDTGKVKSLRQQVFDNSCELACSVPAYRLRFSLNGRFWEKIEAVLR